MRDTVLLVDDEGDVVDLLRYNLNKAGFSVLVAYDGLTGLEMARENRPEVLVLDLMLPGMDGHSVCKALKKDPETELVPILMLTARGEPNERIHGLEVGADDYVTKPFSLRELVSRVRAHLRRASMDGGDRGDEILEAGPVRLDPARHEVTVDGAPTTFPPKEFELLEVLLRRRGRLLTRSFLIEEIWGPGYVGDTKTLDVHVKRIRQKIEPDPHEPVHLLTVRGLGYRFAD